MRLVFFTRNGTKPPQAPPGIEFQHIQFESNKLADLLDIAQYRVINFPTSILLNDKDKVVLRTRGMPSKTTLQYAMQSQ
jgi:hypothetical protein